MKNPIEISGFILAFCLYATIGCGSKSETISQLQQTDSIDIAKRGDEKTIIKSITDRKIIKYIIDTIYSSPPGCPCVTPGNAIFFKKGGVTLARAFNSHCLQIEKDKVKIDWKVSKILSGE
ncbi:MAG: hypothetical protein HY606_01050 [Planctomycetes bacterium]|nr:hypothetical protein [Planctomycetota bacterium]